MTSAGTLFSRDPADARGVGGFILVAPRGARPEGNGGEESESLIDSGPQKVQHRFGGFKDKIDLISITIGVRTKSSTDLERAAAARSIAADFFVLTPMANKLKEVRKYNFSLSHCTFWDPECGVLLH